MYLFSLVSLRDFLHWLSGIVSFRGSFSFPSFAFYMLIVPVFFIFWLVFFFRTRCADALTFRVLSSVPFAIISVSPFHIL